MKNSKFANSPGSIKNNRYVSLEYIYVPSTSVLICAMNVHSVFFSLTVIIL